MAQRKVSHQNFGKNYIGEIQTSYNKAKAQFDRKPSTVIANTMGRRKASQQTYQDTVQIEYQNSFNRKFPRRQSAVTAGSAGDRAIRVRKANPTSQPVILGGTLT